MKLWRSEPRYHCFISHDDHWWTVPLTLRTFWFDLSTFVQLSHEIWSSSFWPLFRFLTHFIPSFCGVWLLLFWIRTCARLLWVIESHIWDGRNELLSSVWSLEGWSVVELQLSSHGWYPINWEGRAAFSSHDDEVVVISSRIVVFSFHCSQIVQRESELFARNYASKLAQCSCQSCL